MPEPENEITHNSDSAILVRRFLRLLQTNAMPEGREPKSPRDYVEMKMRRLTAEALATAYAKGRAEGLEEAATKPSSEGK